MAWDGYVVWGMEPNGMEWLLNIYFIFVKKVIEGPMNSVHCALLIYFKYFVIRFHVPDVTICIFMLENKGSNYLYYLNRLQTYLFCVIQT